MMLGLALSPCNSALAMGVGGPSNAIIDFAGDSRTFQGFDNATGRFYLESRGPASFALPASGHRFRITSPDQFGVGGDTSAQLLARWDTVLASEAGTIALMISVNDRAAGLTLQQSIDNVTSMLNQARAVGKWVLLSDEMPFVKSTVTSEQLAIHVAFHEWLKAAPNQFRMVKHWPTWDLIIDPATIGTTYQPLAGTMLNESGVFIHQLTKGAKLIGESLGAVIRTLLPAVDYSRPYVAGESHAQPALNSNPGMTGTSGSKGSGITGSLATDWTAALNSAGAGILVACTKETIGGVEYQVLTFSGTSSSGSPALTIRPTTDLALTAGQSYDMRAKIVVASGASNILAVTPEARVDGTTLRQSRAMDGYQSPDAVPADGFDLHLCSPPAVVPASGVTTIRGQVVVSFMPSAAVSGVVKIANAAPRLSA